MEQDSQFLSQIILSKVRIRDVYKLYFPEAPLNSSLVKCPNPLHRDSTPSCKLYESLDKTGEPDTLFCFGCGFSGNVISFTAKMEGISLLQAMQVLKQRFGIEEDLQQLSLRDRYTATRLKKEFDKTFAFLMSQIRKFGIEITNSDISELDEIFISQNTHRMKEFYREKYKEHALSKKM